MKNLDEKVRQAQKAGYDDTEIVNYLSERGLGDKIEQARASGYSHNDIVRHLAGEKRGIKERLKQGMAGAYLASGQMGSYLAEKTGLGDIVIGADGIKRITPEESKERREKFEGGIKELNIEKGQAGLGASLVSAAADPSMWAGAGFGGSLVKQGLQAGGLYEAFQPQEGEFDPLKKAQDVTTTAAVSAVAAPVGGYLIDKVAKYSPTALVTKATKYGVDKVKGTPPATARASSRLKELVADPAEAAAKMEGSTISGLSPARQSGEAGLIGVEDAARRANPALEKQFSEAEKRSREILSREAAGIGEGVSASKATEFVGGRRDALVQKLNDSVRVAEQKAQQQIDALGSNLRESEVAVIVRDQLESALSSWRAQEKVLYESIKNAGLTTAGTKNRFKEIVSSTPKAQQDDIPQIAIELLGKKTGLKNIESVRELQGLRSKLLEESRKSRAAGEYNKARIADDLADAVLDDMGAQAGNLRGETGEGLRKALDFSRQLNQTFRQGNVGRVLGTLRTGDDKIAAELTIRSTVGGGNISGSVAARELMQAAPESAAGIREYVVQSFNKAAIKDGALNQQAAQKFLRENADILDNFPDVRQSITDAIGSTATLASKQARAERVTNALFSKQKSATAEYLGAPVDKEFARIVASNDPMKLAGELRKVTAKDASGDALKGLKTGTVEYLFSKAASGADDAGNAIVSGNKLKQLLKDSRTGGAVANILNPDEMKYLRQVADELAALERKGTNITTIIDAPMPNRLMTIGARIVGAKTGAKFGGGNAGASLQAAQIGSANAKEYLNRFMQDKAEELIIQSLHDKKLRELLMMDISTTAKQVEVAKKLSDWARLNKGFFAAPVSSFGAEETREQNDPLRFTITPQDKLPTPEVELPNLSPRSDAGDLFQRIAMVESGGNPDAKNPNSSASGLYQFTDDTWLRAVSKWGKETGIGMQDKNNPQAQQIMMERLAADNAGFIERALGFQPNEGQIYLAHFMGAPAAVKLMKNYGSNRAAALSFPKEAKANRNIFFDPKGKPRTIEQVYDIITKKVENA